MGRQLFRVTKCFNTEAKFWQAVNTDLKPMVMNGAQNPVVGKTMTGKDAKDGNAWSTKLFWPAILSNVDLVEADHLKHHLFVLGIGGWRGFKDHPYIGMASMFICVEGSLTVMAWDMVKVAAAGYGDFETAWGTMVSLGMNNNHSCFPNNTSFVVTITASICSKE